MGFTGKVHELYLRYAIVGNATAKVLIPNANLLTSAITVADFSRDHHFSGPRR